MKLDALLMKNMVCERGLYGKPLINRYFRMKSHQKAIIEESRRQTFLGQKSSEEKNKFSEYLLVRKESTSAIKILRTRSKFPDHLSIDTTRNFISHRPSFTAAKFLMPWVRQVLKHQAHFQGFRG